MRTRDRIARAALLGPGLLAGVLAGCGGLDRAEALELGLRSAREGREAGRRGRLARPRRGPGAGEPVARAVARRDRGPGPPARRGADRPPPGGRGRPAGGLRGRRLRRPRPPALPPGTGAVIVGGRAVPVAPLLGVVLLVATVARAEEVDPLESVLDQAFEQTGLDRRFDPAPLEGEESGDGAAGDRRVAYLLDQLGRYSPYGAAPFAFRPDFDPEAELFDVRVDWDLSRDCSSIDFEASIEEYLTDEDRRPLGLLHELPRPRSAEEPGRGLRPQPPRADPRGGEVEAPGLRDGEAQGPHAAVRAGPRAPGLRCHGERGRSGPGVVLRPGDRGRALGRGPRLLRDQRRAPTGPRGARRRLHGVVPRRGDGHLPARRRAAARPPRRGARPRAGGGGHDLQGLPGPGPDPDRPPRGERRDPTRAPRRGPRASHRDAPGLLRGIGGPDQRGLPAVDRRDPGGRRCRCGGARGAHGPHVGPPTSCCGPPLAERAASDADHHPGFFCEVWAAEVSKDRLLRMGRWFESNLELALGRNTKHPEALRATFRERARRWRREAEDLVGPPSTRVPIGREVAAWWSRVEDDRARAALHGFAAERRRSFLPERLADLLGVEAEGGGAP